MHGLEAYLQNNKTHSCYCPGLCKNWYLSHHMPVEFLHKQPTAECWTWLFMHNRNNWPKLDITIGRFEVNAIHM